MVFSSSLEPFKRIRMISLNDKVIFENGTWLIDPESQHVSVVTKEYLSLGKDGYDVMRGVKDISIFTIEKK